MYPFLFFGSLDLAARGFNKKISQASENSEVPVLAVDYANVDSIAKVLESNQIHAVVSALMVIDETAGTAQINSIKAAARSAPTRQFVAIEYGPTIGPAYVARNPNTAK